MPDAITAESLEQSLRIVDAVVAAVSGAGDRIVCEHLTYSQVSRSANLMGRQITLVDSDQDGILPEDFERVCAREHPKAAFIMSSGQNPTLACLPLSRRKDIVAIARKYNVWLIEDYLYGGMIADEIPLLAELAPDRTFLLNGLSKCVAAGVRGGWVACPPHFSQRIRIAHKMVSGGLPFLLAELSARLVLSGAADEIRSQVLTEISAREAIERYRAQIDRNPGLAMDWDLQETWKREGQVREWAGRYLKATPPQIALTGSTSEGLAMIYGGIKVRPDQEILTTVHEHYATHTILDLRTQRTGTRVRKIELFDNARDASHEQILTAIDRNIRPETRVLGMCWVHSGSGVKLPLGAIGALVDKHNRGRSDGDRMRALGVTHCSAPRLYCAPLRPIQGASLRH